MGKHGYQGYLTAHISACIVGLMIITPFSACRSHPSDTIIETTAQRENDLIRNLEKDNLMIDYCHDRIAWLQGIMSGKFSFGYMDSSRKKKGDLALIKDMYNHSGTTNTAEFLYLVNQQKELMRRIQLKYYHEFSLLTIPERKAVLDSTIFHIIPRDSLKLVVHQADAYRLAHSLH